MEWIFSSLQRLIQMRLHSDHLFDTGYEWTLLELVRERLGDHHFRFDKGDYME